MTTGGRSAQPSKSTTTLTEESFRRSTVIFTWRLSRDPLDSETRGLTAPVFTEALSCFGARNFTEAISRTCRRPVDYWEAIQPTCRKFAEEQVIPDCNFNSSLDAKCLSSPDQKPRFAHAIFSRVNTRRGRQGRR